MEDVIIVAVGLVALSVPALLIYLTVSHFRLRRKVAVMQSQLDLLWRGSASPQTPLPDPAANVVPLAQTAATHDHLDAPAAAPKRKAPWDRPKHGADKPGADTLPPPRKPGKSSQAAVFNAQRITALITWLRENWFYVAAAMSLALAGLFFVQYGIETGLLSPTARVACALGFGAVLICAGEWIRRKYGDGEDSATANLPSVLSGAGLVSLMGGILAARMLYGLIGPTPAFAGLFATAMLGMVLGWFHGSFLAAIGLLGGLGAPFLVGGSSQSPEWLFAYFGLMVVLGLGIDTVRRWAWISVLALVAGLAAGGVLWASDMANPALNAGFSLFCAGLVIVAVLIPARSLWPDHSGPSLSESLWSLKKNKAETVWPIFPARLSLGVTLAVCWPILMTAQNSIGTFWLSLTLASGLTVLFTLWARFAPALQDHAVVPAGLILALLTQPAANAHVRQFLHDTLLAHEEQTEVRMLWGVSIALLAALVPTLVAAWRSFNAAHHQAVWAAGAVLLAPLGGLALELTWQPTQIIGAWPWAFHALGLSCLMTALAILYDRSDGTDKLRVSLAVISALACLAFALGIVLTEAALTLALAATVLAAAALDRRYDLPLLGAYIVAGILALGTRLVLDPGLDWATRAPFWEMLLTYGGTLAALLASLWVQLPLTRPKAQVFLESAAWSVGGMTLSLSVFHMIEHVAGHGLNGLHWQMGLYATIWIALAVAQLHRMKLGGSLIWLRALLAAVYAVLAIAAIAITLSLANPLFERQIVVGPVVWNTLIAGYLLPALALGLMGRVIAQRFRRTRLGIAACAVALAAFWVALTIRHGWRGSDAMSLNSGVSEPELYSYTVALLLTGAGLFYQALARKSDMLRRAGLLVIALAVAKVFLIDISGLQGLVRVFSFLFLGFSLAGLAWLNRWVDMRAGGSPEDADPPSPAPD